MYLATDRIEASAETIDKARQILTAQLPEKHWRIAWAESIQGASLERLEQFEEAEKLLLGSLETLKQGPGSASRTVYIDLTGTYLDDLYRNWRRPEQAARH